MSGHISIASYISKDINEFSCFADKHFLRGAYANYLHGNPNLAICPNAHG